MTTRIVIDCDPGIDDAIAILLALASPELDVRAVTTVAGNVSLERTTANGLAVLALAGRGDVPLAAGCDRPLVRAAGRDAADVHARDGVGGVALPAPVSKPTEEHAVDLVARLVAEAPTTLVAVGPLTNVAVLLARYPIVASQIERLVLMGGSSRGGNTTAAAEFNIWADPEAAVRVLDAGIPTSVVGLDVTLQAVLDADDVAAIAAGGRVGSTAAAMLSHYLGVAAARGAGGVAMHDPLAVAELIDPTLVGYRDARVDVDCGSVLSRGATVVDFRSSSPNVRWGVAVDGDRFAALVRERLARLDRG